MTKLNILYEDNHIIVVVKPAGILSQKVKPQDIDMLTLIKNYIKEKYNKPGNVYLGLVHRLDRPVSGIMVFAKTSKAAARLSKQITNNEMKKNYYAIIEGYLKEKSGTLKDKIEKIDNKRVLLNTQNGKEAILNYKVIKEKGDLSFVDIELVTGRYHQIRLQFSSRNHPLIADALYGKQINHDICLCAYKLAFKHPTTKELLIFEIKPKGKIWEGFI